MSEPQARERNITLTITLDLVTMRHTISGGIPNPTWGLMLAEILYEELKFRFRSALATEAAQRVAIAGALPRIGGQA